jgi:AraC-like DNA-binding protein
VDVSFRVGAAGCILGLPVSELTDCHVPIDTLWGARALELREQLVAAANSHAAFRVLEVALSARLAHPAQLHPAVAQALACPANRWGFTRIEEIRQGVGYSPRHFIALFRAAVGLTPKHYYRVKRFSSALSPGPCAIPLATSGYSAVILRA